MGLKNRRLPTSLFDERSWQKTFRGEFGALFLILHISALQLKRKMNRHILEFSMAGVGLADLIDGLHALSG
jgi:hypothetical protein